MSAAVAEGRRTRRVAPHAPVLETDIYVASGSMQRAQLRRAEQLLRDRKAITIHGLGRMVPRAVELALVLQRRLGSIECHVTTDTVEVVDDIEPDDPEADLATEMRNKSAVHIRVFPATERR